LTDPKFPKMIFMSCTLARLDQKYPKLQSKEIFINTWLESSIVDFMEPQEKSWKPLHNFCMVKMIPAHMSVTRRYTTRRYSMPHYVTPHYATPHYSTLLYATPRSSTLLHATPSYSKLLQATPSYSSLLHATPNVKLGH
jgi:hypothetical protein